LLPPELVASLVSIEEYPVPTDLVLDLGRFYGTAAHDAGPTSAGMGLRHAIDGGQASLR
jgi:hypothetical protein